MLAFSGRALRIARQDRDLRAEQLALKVERSVYSIHSYEVGRTVPSVAVLVRLAGALGRPLEAFFEDGAADDA